MTPTNPGARTTRTDLLRLFPEIALGLLLFDALRHSTRQRLTAAGSDRGDAIQWVIVTAIGAAIAVTVGAIIFNKLEGKANDIDVTTPAPR